MLKKKLGMFFVFAVVFWGVHPLSSSYLGRSKEKVEKVEDVIAQDSRRSVIFISGPCLSGKSSIAGKLCGRLGKSWELVSLDLVLVQKRLTEKANFDENKALDYLVEEINERLLADKNVIVDTHKFEKTLPERLVGSKERTILKILLYVPLSALLKRFDDRWDVLEKYAYMRDDALLQALDSFATFYSLWGEYNSEKIGIINRGEFETPQVASFVERDALFGKMGQDTGDFYEALFSSIQEDIAIYSRLPYDFCVNTHENFIVESADKIFDFCTRTVLEKIHFLKNATMKENTFQNSATL